MLGLKETTLICWPRNLSVDTIGFRGQRNKKYKGTHFPCLLCACLEVGARWVGAGQSFGPQPELSAAKAWGMTLKAGVAVGEELGQIVVVAVVQVPSVGVAPFSYQMARDSDHWESVWCQNHRHTMKVDPSVAFGQLQGQALGPSCVRHRWGTVQMGACPKIEGLQADVAIGNLNAKNISKLRQTKNGKK